MSKGTSRFKASADPFIPGLQLGQVEDREGKLFLRWAAKARNKKTNQVIELKAGAHLADPEQFEFLGAVGGRSRRTRRVRRSRGVKRKLKTRGRRTRGRRYRGRVSRKRKVKRRTRGSRRS